MQLRCSCCSEVRECAQKVAQRSQFCAHCGRITRFTEIPITTTRAAAVSDRTAGTVVAPHLLNRESGASLPTQFASDTLPETSNTPRDGDLPTSGTVSQEPASTAKQPVSDAALLNEVLLRVRFLYTKCQFGDAVSLLLEQNEKHRTAAITSLMMQSMYLSDLQDGAREAARRVARDPRLVFQQSEVIQYQESLKSLNLEDPEFTNPDIPGPKHSRGGKWTTRQRTVTLVVVITLLTIVSVFALRLQEQAANSRGNQTSSEQIPQTTSSPSSSVPETSFGAVPSTRSGLSQPADSMSPAAEQALQLLRDGQPRHASQVLNRSSPESVRQFTEQLINSWPSEIAALENLETTHSQRKSIQYLNDADQTLQATDQGNDQIRIRQVRCEILSHLASLLISEGNYPKAIDTLAKIAPLLPNDPRTREIAGRIAESMVAGMEQGDSRINAELVIPWIDQTERFGVPSDIRSTLHQRVRNARLLAIRHLQDQNNERSLLLAVDAMQALQESHPLDKEITAASKQFTDSLLDQSLNMLNSNNLSAAARKLEAAVSLGITNASSAAKTRLSHQLEERFTSALNKQLFSDAADLYRMLQLLAPEKLPALNAALSMLSARQLATLPDWLRNQIQHQSNSVDMKFVLLPRGEFQMGSPRADLQGTTGPSSDTPGHHVTLTQPCFLGQFEVTRRQYHAVTGHSPESPEPSDSTASDLSDSLPCDQLSWFQAAAFCQTLSELEAEKGAGRHYRLPTEAEWEWACREADTAGTTNPVSAETLAAHAWYANNSGRLQIDRNLSFQSDSDRMQTLIARSQPRLQEIGTRQPNALELHDMQGNAREWVQDWFANYSELDVRDPQGPTSGTEKVLRGGSFRDDSHQIQATRRSAAPPDRALGGFRVVLEIHFEHSRPVNQSTAQAQ